MGVEPTSADAPLPPLKQIIIIKKKEKNLKGIK